MIHSQQNQTLTFVEIHIDTTVSDNEITIADEDATTSNKLVSHLSTSDNFAVSFIDLQLKMYRDRCYCRTK